MHLFCRRPRYLLFLFGVPPLLLGVFFYTKYSLPTYVHHTTSTHLAHGPQELTNFSAIDANSNGKHEDLGSGNSDNIAGKIFAPPKKILTWLYSITDINPQSTSIMAVPFNESFSENYRYLIPRVAFFDKRVHGNYKNATVILTHVIKSLVKPVGCVVDGQHTSKVELKPININGWIHQMHPECTHDNVLIFCFNTPGRNNSKVSVMYENPKNDSEIFVTDSEHPLFVPKSRESSKEFASSVMACTTAYGTPPYFGAWLRYQKTLGVDLVYINAIDSFLLGKAFNDTFLQESLKSGFVQLKVWKGYLKPEALFYHSQALYYQNCVYRFQGVYNYAIMSDFDDFVIPADGKNIIEILQSLFDPKPKLGGIELDWMRYFEPDGGFNYDEILAGKFSKYVEAKAGMKEHNWKSIHKLTATSDVGIHLVAGQMKGYTWTHVPRDTLHMAHFKPNSRERIHYDTVVECVALCIALVLCVW